MGARRWSLTPTGFDGQVISDQCAPALACFQGKATANAAAGPRPRHSCPNSVKAALPKDHEHLSRPQPPDPSGWPDFDAALQAARAV